MIKTSHTIRYFAVLLALLLTAGCQKDDAQQTYEQEAFQVPQNFTAMTVDGQQEGEPDDDDWRISPRYAGLVRFYSDDEIRYPYPNPAATDQRVTFEMYISLDALEGLVVGGYNQQDQFVPLYTQYDTPNGLITFRINPSNLAQIGGEQAVGLHRIFIFDSADNLITYGDIKIE
jgi:hypothetical protein